MLLKSAVSPPAEQNKPLPGEDVELAKEVTSYEGTKNDTKYFNLKVNRNFWFEADNLTNHKNYNFLACDWFKKVLFSTYSLAKLVSDSLLLDSLLSDSSISQSYSKM